jgi:hypothetical protein
MSNLTELLGKDLNSFTLEQLYEVWTTDEKGFATTPLGAFKKETLAKAFAGNDKSSWGAPTIIPVTVLTDGKLVFAIDKTREIKLFNDEEQAVELRQKALAKLSPEDKAILGLN